MNRLKIGFVLCLVANLSIAGEWFSKKNYVSYESDDGRKLEMMYHPEPGIVLGISGHSQHNNVCERMLPYGKKRPNLLGDYEEVQLGLANVNGTYVKMAAVCLADSTDVSTGDNLFWNAEVQPDSHQGKMYFLGQLLEGKGLTIEFDTPYLDTFVVEPEIGTSHFKDFIDDSIKKMKAL
ncbi:hypothetical protein OPW41_16050 [Vibrio europaeus]|uniref:Uncharacterized protein n=1 Tax=Vibrio europaeus TaxID=300876 RepID=A0A178JDL7_9VIBR|nr:hypothetical protein [Vibrio europaeus]MDC5703799.1 hypothetical protein [Vibrio europaeus]MDC5708247.1 hypothetical protein [Vibrio europaeus]MDC5714346.1 hypothetical protein [Vibrio europaeus]MDC5722547.1 hypothetical protein [Vibrio europaeus]MDC5727172.1 hypothetical protein [Vibrio europaeus]